jgi:hypothetical protein
MNAWGLCFVKRLFLKWCLTTVVTLVVAFIAVLFAREQSLQLSPIVQIMVGLIAMVYLVAAGYCGQLCWRTDKALEDFEKDRLSHTTEGREEIRKYLRKIQHKTDHLSFTANWLPYIGMFGAVAGITVFLEGAGGLRGGVDAAHIKEIMSNAMSGIGLAFIPTLTGIFLGPIILSWQHHMVQHEVEYALNDFRRGETYARA